MTDLQRLRTHPRRPAPPDRYAEIMASARRRQRRAVVGAGGGMVALAGILAAVVFTGNGVNESLRLDTPAGQPTTASSSAPASNTAAGASTGLAPAAEAGSTAPRVVAPAPAPTAQQTTSPGRQARSQPMKRTPYDGYTVCGGIASHPNPTVPRYCGELVVERTPAGVLDFGLRAMLDAAATHDSSFSFDTTQEVDLVLSRGGRVIWRWSQGQTFAQLRHTLVVKPGNGYRWTTSWRPTDRYGRALPKGDYEVTGTVRAHELGSSNAWSATVTL